jgi:hypothetical protein
MIENYTKEQKLAINALLLRVPGYEVRLQITCYKRRSASGFSAKAE